MYSDYFKMRLEDRNIDAKVIDYIKIYDTNEWKLVTVEVINDKGKFINSTWEKVMDALKYWITIGFNNTIQTIVIKESYGKDKCITSGALFDYVSSVNRELMESEG